MRGGYRPLGTVIRTVTLEGTVEAFRELGKRNPLFQVKDAAAAKIWGSHIAGKVGLRFNEVKELAGLSVNRERGEYAKLSPEERKNEYISTVPPKKEKGPLVNRCLRMYDGGSSGPDKQCTTRLPKGEYFCPECRSWKNNQ